MPQLKASIEGLKSQQKTLQEQITQSESNLAAQQTVTMEQARLQSNEAIRKAKWEHLELLASDTGIDLEEMETVLQPIIENCTKESISGGKIWIFSKVKLLKRLELHSLHTFQKRVKRDFQKFWVICDSILGYQSRQQSSYCTLLSLPCDSRGRVIHSQTSFDISYE